MRRNKGLQLRQKQTEKTTMNSTLKKVISKSRKFFKINEDQEKLIERLFTDRQHI
jgi:hypothetical protein